MAAAHPTSELAAQIIGDKGVLHNAIENVIGTLSTTTSPEDVVVITTTRLQDCVEFVKHYLAEISPRQQQSSSMIDEINSNQMEESKPEEDDAMPMTPRQDDRPPIIDQILTMSAKMKADRLHLHGINSYMINELKKMSEIGDRFEVESTSLHQYCQMVLTRPVHPFTIDHAISTRSHSLRSSIKAKRMELTRMRAEREFMDIHGLPIEIQSQADHKLHGMMKDIKLMEEKAAGGVTIESVPTACLQSGLWSACSLDEYTMETQPLSTRTSRCLLHGHHHCVLKVFDTSDPKQSEALAADITVRAALQESCIYVAPVNTIFLENGKVYVESPIYDKGNAEDWVASRPDAHEVRHLIILLLRALAALHARGICHGNLHARNILLVSHDFSPVLIDFSRARQYPHLSITYNQCNVTMEMYLIHID